MELIMTDTKNRLRSAGLLAQPISNKYVLSKNI